MDSLTFEKDKCTIKLNDRFYSKEVIEIAINSSKENIKLTKEGMIEIKGKKKAELELKARDFCDKLLSIIQEN